ncbi:MAG: hypothetical protein JXM69_02410 [Anaerolineae bacterium]|nr:hypothetical protein [Anaerolineae bacterium]
MDKSQPGERVNPIPIQNTNFTAIEPTEAQSETIIPGTEALSLLIDASLKELNQPMRACYAGADCYYRKLTRRVRWPWIWKLLWPKQNG